jgi:HD superfamily phosphohydrolase
MIDGSSASTGLPDSHPLVHFAREPDKVENILTLDDTVVWGSLSLMADATDHLIAEFAHRLCDRRLYKCVDVRMQLSRLLEDDSTGSQKFDRSCASVKEKVTEWLSEKPGATHRILIDEEVREPYRRFQESKGPLNQIRIKTASGSLVDLGEISKIVKAIEPFRLFRLYCADGDSEARAFIERTIEGEAKNGTR